MKKLGMLSVTIMMMVLFFALQVQAARPGAMQDLTPDKRIKDCSCPPCCDTVKKEKAAPQKKVTIALNVLFDTNKCDVKEKYNNEIQKVADFMKEYPNTKAVIEGHTDNVGDAKYNVQLSQCRADSVRKYLIDKFGIDGKRLAAKGYGQDKPIASNDTPEGRQKNRRVTAVISTVKAK
jgi:OmpA-OmpF porin, OOP family